MPISTRATLAPGDRIPVREVTTIHGKQVRMPAPDGVTHLQFRRFAGCPICNVHLRSLARRHDEILAAGVREVVVFHSTAEEMRPYQGALPFAAVADPDRELYAEFGVGSSPRAVLHPRALAAPLRRETWSVVAEGHRAGAPSWPRRQHVLGLPADLLIDPDGGIVAARYGRHADDQWTVDELLRLGRRAAPPDRPAGAPVAARPGERYG